MVAPSAIAVGLEIDAIVQVADARRAAFEIKLGSRLIDEAGRNLLAFTRKVDTDRCGNPAPLAAITGSGYGFQRSHGVWVLASRGAWAAGGYTRCLSPDHQGAL